MAEDIARQSSKLTLGKHLASLRNAAQLSLRQVEEATNKEVSNAYLSQLENDKINKPSPNILHALSHVYSTSYEDLMGAPVICPPRQTLPLAGSHASQPSPSRISRPKRKKN